MKRVLSLLAVPALLVLAACSPKPAQVSRTVGVGRETAETETAVSGESLSGVTAETPSADTGALWTFADGTYDYHFPERDDSGLNDLSGLDALRYIPFDDANPGNNDWYFGPTVRDPATGAVTFSWGKDRSDATLAALEKYGVIYRGDETEKAVYLTFDCGYETGTTASILDTLKAKKVPATFFVNGHYVESAQDMIRRMIDEGHILAIHCVNHYDLTTVDAETFIREVQGLEDIFYTYFPDADPMIYFRPPSGAANEWVLDLADRMGYTTVMWSWAHRDYVDDDQPGHAETIEKIKTGLHNGCVYLLHPESTTNTAILGDMIDWIRSQGYEFYPLCAIETE
ncbi:MAG: polysaccharide deacetylase family protein [Lentisphaeria bacterium]|nr:polysaccharide deacetylase family protein [Lentisphaeria bacterium]